MSAASIPAAGRQRTFITAPRIGATSAFFGISADGSRCALNTTTEIASSARSTATPTASAPMACRPIRNTHFIAEWGEQKSYFSGGRDRSHELVMAPTPTPEELEAAGLTTGGRFEAFLPERDMLRIMELQRAKPGPTDSEGSTQAHVVGGHAVLTTVNQYAIQQRVLHRWRDRVGRRIKPHAGPAWAGTSDEQ